MPKSPDRTAHHLMYPIFSPIKIGAKIVINIAELWANAVTRPIGISWIDKKTGIIVIIPKNDLNNTLTQLLIWKNKFFLINIANKKSKGRENTNLPKIVIKKSTSLVRDFIIKWVNSDSMTAKKPRIDPNKLLDIKQLKINYSELKSYLTLYKIIQKHKEFKLRFYHLRGF